MFDNPRKDLKWLEQQLLAEQQPQEDPGEDWFEEEEDWLDDELQEARSLLEESAVRRNPPEDIFRFLEEDIQEEEAAESYAGSRRSSREGRNTGKEKGVGGLVFLACLETLGIIAVLLWWVKWLL